MIEKPVKWYSNRATRFIELLGVHTWNESVRILKAEKDVIFCCLSEVEGKTA